MFQPPYELLPVHALVAVSLTLAAAAPAGAACVHPDGDDGCETTIQAGIDIAAAGEIVDIAKGVYFENVVVPPGLDGLVLRGKSAKKTIVDADAPNTGIGIDVRSNNVRIEGLTVRNGIDAGISLMAGTSGALLVGVAIVGADGHCLVNDATGTTVAGGTFRGCDDGIESTGADLTVADSEFLQLDSAGIDHDADRLTVTDSTFRMIDADGINAAGSDTRVAGCKFERIFDFAVEVDGPGARLVDNKVEVANRGLDIGAGLIGDSSAARVTGNKISNVFGNGVRWFCSTTCLEADVSGNKISWVFDDEAIDLSSDEGTLTVLGNKISEVREEALFLRTSGAAADVAVVDGNKIKRAGYVRSDVVCFDGGGILFSNNSVVGAGGTGLRIDRADIGAILDGNKFSGGLSTGIQVGGNAGTNSVGVALTGNKVKKNLGAGVELLADAIDTALSENKLSKNGTDLCDGGTTTMLDGTNKFDTVAPCS